MAIERFRGQYFYLSNMSKLARWIITTQGIYVPTSEHCYMANRLVDSDLHRQVAEAKPVSGLASIWALGMSAKTLAYKFFEQGAERVDDDSVEARLANMFNAVNQKFTVNSDLGDLLVETGDQLIVEGNDHGDTFWGVDSRSGEGQNHLGQTLMRVRGGLALAT